MLANTTLNIDLEPVIAISVPASAALNCSPNPSNNAEPCVAIANINVATNNSTGYTLSLSATNTNLVHSIDSSHQVPTLDNPTTLDNFTLDHWGYSIDGNNFNSITTTGSTITTTSTASTISTTAVTFGSRVSTNTLAGTYTGTVTFSATTNYVPTPLSTISDMQQMTTKVCDDTPTPEAFNQDGSINADVPTKQLRDVRDGKLYWVAKLADGNCWMTQNLDLDVDHTANLTFNDTDVAEYWRPDFSTEHQGDYTSWDTDIYTNTHSWDPGNYYIPGGGVLSTCYKRNLNQCTNGILATVALTSQEAYGNVDLHYHVGNLYEWSTSTTGSGDGIAQGADAISSICPRGWRLPPAASWTKKYSFGALTNSYNITQSATGASDTKLLDNPLYFVRVSYIYGNSFDGAGTQGGLWTSTAVYNHNAQNMSFNEAEVSPTYSSGYRSAGLPIRCVAR